MESRDSVDFPSKKTYQNQAQFLMLIFGDQRLHILSNWLMETKMMTRKSKMRMIPEMRSLMITDLSINTSKTKAQSKSGTEAE